MSSSRFDGHVAVVSGGGNGIGAATVDALARDGAARIHIIDINAERTANIVETARSRGATVTTHIADASDPRTWNAVREHIQQDGGRLDILINNAYTARIVSLLDQSIDDWNRQIGVNLTSIFHSAKALMPPLLASYGSMVNVASVHAFVGLPGYPAYAASKGGIISLTRQLAIEYGPTVRVNAVSPGPVLTGAWDDNTAEERSRSAAATALGRLGEPAEVAEAICFLASASASFITATNLVVDGGWLAKKDSD